MNRKAVQRVPLVALLPSLLLSALLAMATQPTPAADRGPVIEMTVTPVE